MIFFLIGFFIGFSGGAILSSGAYDKGYLDAVEEETHRP